jgi:U3 small nucleolar RNA-associated protein 22
MSVLTNGGSGRATKRRKLSHSPVGKSSRKNDLEASDVSSSNEDAEFSTLMKRPAVSHQNHANGGGTATLPTGGLTRSSMLALQVNELLAETRHNHERLISRLEMTIQRLQDIISQIPPRRPMLITEAEKTLKAETGVHVPFGGLRPAKDTKVKFEYQAPAIVEHVGPLALKLTTNAATVTTLAVQMPEGLLQEKDYLNHRAFQKRAYYLACIAAGLKDAKPGEFDLQFEKMDDLDLIPVILVKHAEYSPTGFLQSKIAIRIAVTFPNDAIPIDKTRPDKNCVRNSTTPGDELAVEGTALYNSCARSLASASTIQRMLHDTTTECDAFADTSRLASVWLQQRGMGSSKSEGGFGVDEWNILCVLLLKTGGNQGQPLLSSRYTTIQLFKAVLQFLATKDLTSPMVIRSKALQLPKAEYPVLYDGATGVNIFGKMTSWSYQALREETSLSLASMNARNEDNFDAVFIVREADPLLKFDELYCIEVPASTSTKKIFQVLTEGLGDRVKRINITVPSPSSWEIGKTNKKPVRMLLKLGILLAPDNKDRLVDHGPSAEDQEDAAKFRVFWGEKAELRRFKDGSIVESLVWSEDGPVTFQIIQYLLEKHFDVSASSLLSAANQVDGFVLDQASQLKPVEAFKLLNTAYQSLTTQLHHLEELPLRIRSIGPADAQLSSSSVISPLSSIHTKPADTYIEFENSTRWPDNLPAIQHTKIAFLLKLGDVMQAAHPELTTRVGLENTETASSGHLNTSYLDIIYPSSAPDLPPISFRLRIHHDREQTLIEKTLASKSLTPHDQNAMSSALQIEKRTLALQRHTTQLRILTTRFPALSGTIRLLKKWTSSHLLPPSLLHDPILELLAIHAFTHPAPWTTPSSAQTAFLRTLHTLSRWDWAYEPLLIDTSVDGSLFSSASDVENLKTRFTAWRKLDPNMNNVVLFIGSNLDSTGVVWTQGQRPPRVIAARLTALAKASIAVIREKGVETQEADWKGLFQSPLSDFDFLIHLKRGFGRGEKKEKTQAKFKNLQLQESMDEEQLGFDPAELFVQDLEKIFGESILFFHDRDGGNVVAGLWNPRVLKRQNFRVRLGVSSMPVATAKTEDQDGKEQVVINQAAVLAEIAMMGEGLVQKVEVVKDFVQ